MIAYKAFTSTLHSPIQGGKTPVWDGTLPYLLPKVPLSLAPTECAKGDTGWYATKDPKTTLKISRLWPDGRPIRLFKVQLPEGSNHVKRGNKIRAEYAPISLSWPICFLLYSHFMGILKSSPTE